MEFDKKTIFAFILIGLILVLVNTDFYQRMVYGDLPKNAPATTAPSASSKTPNTVVTPAEAALGNSAQATQAAIGASDTLAAEIEPEQEIVVETPLYLGVFSTRGGNIKAWTIKGYETSDKKPLTLFKDGIGNLTVALPQREDTLNTATLNFTPSQSAVHLTKGQTQKLVFERQIAAGKILRKTFQFSADVYQVKLQVEILGARDLVEGYQYTLGWQSGLASTEHNVKDDMSDAIAYAYTNGELLPFDVKDKSEDKQEEKDRDIAWVAMRTKYFVLAVIPQGTPARGASFLGQTAYIPGTEVRLKNYAMRLAMPIARQETTAHEYELYLGPLALNQLQAFGVGLESIMNWGWAPVKPFSRIVLWALLWLHKFVPNYGVVIFIFAVLVKLILHPLTKKSYVSMQQMKELQPKMEEVREKYAKDPQKMNTEVMKLYQTHGVNPLGGCLPMVLQMPLLYALFTIFRSTIEFRHAHFFGWITDLSAPDSIFLLPFSLPLYGNSVNVLPLVMGVTMFVQQKMSVTDPKQKAMIYMMPVLFTLLFNNWSSGLNWYYTLFNIFSIIQQKMISSKPVSLEPPKPKQSKFSMSQMRKLGLNAALSRNRALKK